MTKEEKELLLKDLLGRALYGVKVNYRGNIFILGYNLYLNNGDVAFENYPMLYSLEKIESVKPYLRPMSSMTEEEKNEYKMFIDYSYNDFTSESHPCVFTDNIENYINWLNKNMFDYRGLIPMGLALEASEGMYKN